MTLLLCLLLSASAQVRMWTVGEGGVPWASQGQVSVAVDLRDPRTLKPYSFSPDENIVEAVGPWQDLLNYPPRDLRTEGGSRVWNRSAEGFPNAPMVDGDPTTSTGESYKQFGADQTGRTFYFDLGASYPADRIVFYPSPSGMDDYIRAFEVSISDGRHFTSGGEPIYEVLRRVEVNREPRVELPVPTQLLRFIKLRVLSPNPFEIAELEVYGRGFVPRARYVSKLVEFEGGRPVVFGALRMKVRKLGEGEAWVTLQVRNGADDTPLIYYRKDPETQAQEEDGCGQLEPLVQPPQGRGRGDLGASLRFPSGSPKVLPVPPSVRRDFPGGHAGGPAFGLLLPTFGGQRVRGGGALRSARPAGRGGDDQDRKGGHVHLRREGGVSLRRS